MKSELAIESLDSENFYTCTKSGKKIRKDNPICPTPNTYCKYRSACIIFDLYKEKLKSEKK
jgi:hypothetical protein